MKSRINWRKLGVLDVDFVECEEFNENDTSVKLYGVRAYSFYQDKLVMVFAEKKAYWTVPGGEIEKGETVAEAAIRELKEEANMKVLKQILIGYVDVPVEGIVRRYPSTVCLVEPYGDFVSDPDGDITKIELIDPKDFKKYFDLGEVGDLLMAKTLELKERLI